MSLKQLNQRQELIRAAKLLMDHAQNADALSQSGTHEQLDRHNLIIHFARRGDADGLKKLLNRRNVDVNVQDEFGMTALHHAAAMGARPCIRLLVGCGKCDYLIQDNRGRFAYELAFEWAHDYAVGVLLSKKYVQAESAA